MRARAARLQLVIWLAACAWIVPVSAGAAIPIMQPFVTVSASEWGGSAHAIRISALLVTP